MTGRRMTPRIGLAFTGLLALTACGNANDDIANIVKQLPKGLFSNKEQSRPLSAQQIAQTLASTTASLALFEFEARDNARIVLQDIQRNGPYQTYGNQARLVIVLRQGMVTSTRGFGGDLMSSETDQLLSYVQSRTEGRVSYDQRFLTADNQTVVYRYSCHVIPGGPMSDDYGNSGQSVSAKCTSVDGGTQDFTNVYSVGPDGYITAGRQWIGPTIGYVNSQILRR